MAVPRTEPPLIQSALNAEEVAAGLHRFREELPLHQIEITGIVGELFTVSAALREFEFKRRTAESSIRHGPAAQTVRSDMQLFLQTLKLTLDVVLDMFARSRVIPCKTLWDDLVYRLDELEQIGLLPRLKWYNEFLRGQVDIMTDGRARDLGALRRRLVALYDTQSRFAPMTNGSPVDLPAAPTAPTPGHERRRPDRPEIPSPSTDWSYPSYMPSAPDPPHPGSPLYTNSSSDGFFSTHASPSSEYFALFSRVPSRRSHWAELVFNGQYPSTQFRRAFQRTDQSLCRGATDERSLEHLERDRFLQAIEIPFDDGDLRVRLYWRPDDNRARILATTRDKRGRERHCCTPLKNLRIRRNRSMLQLCKVGDNETFDIWAKLNFYSYERMALFFCTFVAMKAQDSRRLPHEMLHDDIDLVTAEPELGGEEQEFSGAIRHGDMKHALRMFRDRSSNAVRLEASALRGRYQNVPIWTAFVTRYAHDPDWLRIEPGQDNVVSLIDLRPPPSFFLSGYEIPRNMNGEPLLQFVTVTDARIFVERWTSLSRRV